MKPAHPEAAGRVPGTGRQSGVTLVEIIVVVSILGSGAGMYAKAVLDRASRRADLAALAGTLTIASRKALVEASHFGVHYDSATGTVGLFEDQDGDGAFSGGDTLEAAFRLDHGARLSIRDSDSLGLRDICFKKNGAVAAGVSFGILYTGAARDTFGLTVFAASGRVMESGR